MNERDEVVQLYQRFDRYKNLTKEMLLCHIDKPFQLNQFKIQRNNDSIVSFTSWAFLSEKHEQHYKKTGQMLFNFWNSGDRCWIIDSIVHDDNFDDVYNWAKEYFGKELNVDSVSWLRIRGITEISEQKTIYNRNR